MASRFANSPSPALGPTGSSGKRYQMPTPLFEMEPAAALLVSVVRGEVIQKVAGSLSEGVSELFLVPMPRLWLNTVRFSPPSSDGVLQKHS